MIHNKAYPVYFISVILISGQLGQAGPSWTKLGKAGPSWARINCISKLWKPIITSLGHFVLLFSKTDDLLLMDRNMKSPKNEFR